MSGVGRRLRTARRRLREAGMLARAFRHRYRPVAAHLVAIRRCNLSCTYCTEYDDRSAPVPQDAVLRRVDLLADLGTGVVTVTGGEPLLHPYLDDIVRRIRGRGMIATVITNGYLLTRERIRRLNRAGLDHLQISIDNVLPDEVSKKSLKVLRQKLVWLAAEREFGVTVNSVLGSSGRNPEDALTIARDAKALGLSTMVGLLHDHGGQLLPLDDRQRAILDEIVALGRSLFDFANYNRFQVNLAHGRPNEWHCRAGSRYLYVCEDGLVHWCSQQRGWPGIPLERYGREDLEREYHRVKACAPFCTVGCVHRVAQVDDLRCDAPAALARWFPGGERQSGLPPAIRLLVWAFVTGPRRELFRSAATRLLALDRRE